MYYYSSSQIAALSNPRVPPAKTISRRCQQGWPKRKAIADIPTPNASDPLSVGRHLSARMSDGAARNLCWQMRAWRCGAVDEELLFARRLSR
ncbi:hypothetical protein CEXT_214361 [Caerostris extrusa]|uniref:Uncharacterized protein n=1 Tax=Caerostris extrusa TaxID=172846 RepID=A0AAV4NBF9_CAEEX|nr:hypothetical protein CEXT_214361 [Caerostris extrusa]